jgi:hypothetical protein
MLVWYRDAQYTVNHVTAPIFAPPSTGSKGQPPPGAARCAHLTDAKGCTGAGVARRGPVLPRRRRLGVVPSKDNRRYTTRIVDENSSPLTGLYGLDPGDGIILGSGDPADGNPLDTPVEDLSLGVEFVVCRAAGSNQWR